MSYTPLPRNYSKYLAFRLPIMNTWFVYMIRCKDGSLYTGSTNNVIRRWRKHRQGNGAKYLQAHQPKTLVYVEEHPNRSEACKREYEIKQFAKQDKESLIGAMLISCLEAN